MNSHDNHKQNWGRFKEEVTKLDKIRNEDFWATFPEFQELKNVPA